MHTVEVWPHLDKINVNQINSQLLKNLPAKKWASQTSKLEVWELSFLRHLNWHCDLLSNFLPGQVMTNWLVTKGMPYTGWLTSRILDNWQAECVTDLIIEWLACGLSGWVVKPWRWSMDEGVMMLNSKC